MKTRLILFCLLSTFLYFSCEEGTVSNVGIGITPEGDKVNVYDTTIMITASTVEVDSIYARTTEGYLGEIYDPSYGTIKAGYACQFYPSYNFEDIDKITNGKIDSVTFTIAYSYKGDSLAPMELTIYPINQPLNKHYYTNSDPAEFCDMSNPLAKFGYTARNLNIPDAAIVDAGLHWVSVPLPTEFGQKVLELAKQPAPNIFTSADSLLSYFPGAYVASTFGTGSILNVISTEIHFYYTTPKTIVASDGVSDSTKYVSNYASWAVTKEVIQLNSFKNNNNILLRPDSSKMYVKSPAGVVPEIIIPIREIVKGIGRKKFSSVKLILSAYPKEDWLYTLNFPGLGTISSNPYRRTQLLLIEPDSVKNFFEQQQLAKEYTSFMTTFDQTTYSYKFNNIANVVQNAIDKNLDQDLRLQIFPVITNFTYDNNGYIVDYSTLHDLNPSEVTLKKGGDNLSIRIIATDLKIND
ncbi:hypothetical protein FACS1894160_1050 [Bacteroidia bacterium]|nr:hypothetical protein FACS1894160_1050 [Bacteroidia bacterium]